MRIVHKCTECAHDPVCAHRKEYDEIINETEKIHHENLCEIDVKCKHFMPHQINPKSRVEMGCPFD